MALAGLVFVFAWLLPSGGFSVMLGYSEHFGYELRDCQTEMVHWLRAILLQYLLCIFLLWYSTLLPSGYWVYLSRFGKESAWSTILGLFMVQHLAAPGITLVLQLRLASACSDRLEFGHSMFYWSIVAIQAFILLVMLVFIYSFYGDFKYAVLYPIRQRRERLAYARKVLDILRTGKNLGDRYNILLKANPSFHEVLLQEEIILLRMTVCKKLNKKCADFLKVQRRVCAQCTGGFAVSDRVHYMEQCRHLAHWECFESVATQKGNCSECSHGSLTRLKHSITTGDAKDLEQLLGIQPAAKARQK